MLLHARHICTKACIAQLYACIHMHRQSNTFCFTGTKCSESTFLLTLETKWGVLLVTGLQGSEKEGERNGHRWSRRRSNTKKTNTIATFPHYLANISQIPSIFQKFFFMDRFMFVQGLTCGIQGVLLKVNIYEPRFEEIKQ